MPNADSPLNGQGHDIDLMIDPVSGDARLKAAGDDLGLPSLNDTDHHATPQLVQQYTRGTLTDRSGTITVGGVAQDIASANSLRRYLLVQNLDSSEDLWVDFGTDAIGGSPSILLAPRSGLVMDVGFIDTQRVSVIAATISHSFAAKEG